MKMSKYRRRDFETDFPDDAACLDWTVSVPGPDGIKCPLCRTIPKRRRVAKGLCCACGRCGHHERSGPAGHAERVFAFSDVTHFGNAVDKPGSHGCQR